MVDTFICLYCWNPVEAEDYPDKCPHCKVTRCNSCYSYLKDESLLCHGCGVVNPSKKAAFVRSDSYAAVYSWEGWLSRGSGKKEFFYEIWGDKEGHFLQKNIKGERTIVRRLTNEEEEVLKNANRSKS